MIFFAILRPPLCLSPPAYGPVSVEKCQYAEETIRNASLVEEVLRIQQSPLLMLSGFLAFFCALHSFTCTSLLPINIWMITTCFCLAKKYIQQLHRKRVPTKRIAWDYTFIKAYKAEDSEMIVMKFNKKSSEWKLTWTQNMKCSKHYISFILYYTLSNTDSSWTAFQHWWLLPLSHLIPKWKCSKAA